MKNVMLEKLEKIERLLLDQDKPLSLEQAAEYLQISKSFIYKLTSSGKIPFYKSAKLIYFRKSDLNQFAFRNRRSTDEELEQKAIERVLETP